MNDVKRVGIPTGVRIRKQVYAKRTCLPAWAQKTCPPYGKYIC